MTGIFGLSRGRCYQILCEYTMFWGVDYDRRLKMYYRNRPDEP